MDEQRVFHHRGFAVIVKNEDLKEFHLALVSNAGNTKNGDYIWHFDPKNILDTRQRLSAWGKTLNKTSHLTIILRAFDDTAVPLPFRSFINVINNEHAVDTPTLGELAAYDCYWATCSNKKKVASSWKTGLEHLKAVASHDNDSLLIDWLSAHSSLVMEYKQYDEIDGLRGFVRDLGTHAVEGIIESKFDTLDDIFKAEDALLPVDPSEIQYWRLNGTVTMKHKTFSAPAKELACTPMAMSPESVSGLTDSESETESEKKASRGMPVFRKLRPMRASRPAAQAAAQAVPKTRALAQKYDTESTDPPKKKHRQESVQTWSEKYDTIIRLARELKAEQGGSDVESLRAVLQTKTLRLNNALQDLEEAEARAERYKKQRDQAMATMEMPATIEDAVIKHFAGVTVSPIIKAFSHMSDDAKLRCAKALEICLGRDQACSFYQNMIREHPPLATTVFAKSITQWLFYYKATHVSDIKARAVAACNNTVLADVLQADDIFHLLATHYCC